MSAEHQSRLEAIKSALTTTRQMVAAGPTDEIPLSTIEGLADTSIPLLEQLEIHEEYVINPDGDSTPYIDKINTPFRRELYQQLYSSAQRGILPTRDAPDLNPEAPKEESFFAGIPNDQLPDGLDLFKEGSSSYIYYEFVASQLKLGVVPKIDDIRTHMVGAGFAPTSYNQTRHHIDSVLKKLANPSTQGERILVRPEGLPSSYSQGFPIFTPPERKDPEIKKEIGPKDTELLVRISTLLPVEKAAATALFDRLQGNSITSDEWLAAIQKECPQHKITSYFLDGIIERLRDSGLTIVSSKAKGETSYYRMGNK